MMSGLLTHLHGPSAYASCAWSTELAAATMLTHNELQAEGKWLQDHADDDSLDSPPGRGRGRGRRGRGRGPEPRGPVRYR